MYIKGVAGGGEQLEKRQADWTMSALCTVHCRQCVYRMCLLSATKLYTPSYILSSKLTITALELQIHT